MPAGRANTVTLIASFSGQTLTSPPTIGQWKASPVFFMARYSASASSRLNPLGRATLVTAPSGKAAIEATSERFRAMALRPTFLGPCSASVKCTPSSNWSTVTSSRSVPHMTIAQSSPGPTGTAEGSSFVCDRIQLMNSNSFM